MGWAGVVEDRVGEKELGCEVVGALVCGDVVVWVDATVPPEVDAAVGTTLLAADAAAAL